MAIYNSRGSDRKLRPQTNLIICLNLIESIVVSRGYDYDDSSYDIVTVDRISDINNIVPDYGTESSDYSPLLLNKIVKGAVNLVRLLEAFPADFVRSLVAKAARASHYRSGKLRPEADLLISLKRLGNVVSVRRLSVRIDDSSISEFSARSRIVNSKKIASLIVTRLEARRAKDFAEADRIRNELDAMGIALKDAKDPTTGEIVTTWEVKR
ncbi:CysS/YqeB C-terminal domain-containing protein [Kaistia algarum]